MSARPSHAAKTHVERPTSGPSQAARGRGEVRLIGGFWKRIKLKVADKPGLRPTPDRVRETLFNWLGQDLRGWRCLDAFAGSGALGLEAVSRGAAEVLLVENDTRVVAQLQQVVAHLQTLQLPSAVTPGVVRVQRGSGLEVLRQMPTRCMDLVFLDPPFDAGLFEDALAAASQALASNGRLYLESPAAWNDAQLERFDLAVVRHMKAGMVHAHLLRHRPATTA